MTSGSQLAMKERRRELTSGARRQRAQAGADRWAPAGGDRNSLMSEAREVEREGNGLIVGTTPAAARLG
jgi:hypothetical protein